MKLYKITVDSDEKSKCFTSYEGITDIIKFEPLEAHNYSTGKLMVSAIVAKKEDNFAFNAFWYVTIDDNCEISVTVYANKQAVEDFGDDLIAELEKEGYIHQLPNGLWRFTKKVKEI